MNSIVEHLRRILNNEDQVSIDIETLLKHGKDQSSYHPTRLPNVVVYPENVKEIQEIVKFASKHEVPIVPFGLGSSVEGQVIPVQGGISLNMTRMDKITEICPEDYIVRVQSGVTRNQLNRELRKHNLFFPVDPAIDATLGGMAATNASGTNAVRYGTMRNQVLGLEIVQANGEVIQTGGQYLKTSAGYNLTGLFIGSEGTLGIITELILRVYVLPEETITITAGFQNVEAASKAVGKLMKCGMSLGRVEIVDENTVYAINCYKNINLPVSAQLIMNLAGKKYTVKNDLIKAKEILLSEGCNNLKHAFRKNQREQLWMARHEAAFAILSLEPQKRLMTTDVCVPLTVMPQAIENARMIMNEHQIKGAVLGHVGDGNFHAVFTVDPSDSFDVKRAQTVNSAIVDFALKNGGTCTGEHGIGIGKIEYLQQQHDDLIVTMKKIKDIFDPQHIMNPGKILS